MKIKNIGISGVRGIKKNVNIVLDSSKSILIYGDNGSGKSSITDAIEWFYYDKVEHLSTEEIGRKGINALRNTFLADDEDAFVELKFSGSGLDCNKKLFLKRSKLTSEYSNLTHEFNNYLNLSKRENLILRYRDLLRFVFLKPTPRLEELSQIIGFSEVSKIKSIFKKAVNDLKKEIKINNFDSKINQKQAQILEQINQPVYNDEQYFGAVRELVAPLKLPIEVKDDRSVGGILELIKKPEDEEALRLQLSYEKVIENVGNLKDSVANIQSSYSKYYEKYQIISRDIEKFKKISLERLLSEGLAILERKVFEDEKCPLCLQEKSREELIDELRKRIEELANFKKEKEELQEERKITLRFVQNTLSEIEAAQGEKCLFVEENLEIKSEVEQFKNVFSDALDWLKNLTFIERKEIKKPEEFIYLDNSRVQHIISTLRDRKGKITTARKDDLKFSISSKLILVRQAYKEIKSLKRESEILTKQQQSMDLIYREFVRKQKEGLISFLKTISRDINELYLYMNKSEAVDEIELIPLGEDDEFIGITIQFKFHGKNVSPPDKYLSESHLNCLGICLFLSSIKAFNEVNKFFILDDVISSFDKSHRLRFANLLMEKFSDYQIFIFTHEKDWFEYVVNMVKSKKWIITKMIWDYENGATLDIPLLALKERIEDKIKKSDPSELGNMVRKFLERLLKEICLNLEVKVRFLYNDQNENRMSSELLSELRANLKRRKCELKDHQVLDRLSASIFLGNRTSHNSSFLEDISDLKTFYDDVIELENLFICNDCGKYISKRYYDSVENQIRCSCGGAKYNWKE